MSNRGPANIQKKLTSRSAPDANGCLVWRPPLRKDGYGRVRFEGRDQVAHRVAYQVYVGPIPDGLQIDHLCRNRACVNPAHLEPVSCKENLRRGIGITATNAVKTHCPAGHEYSEDNTYLQRSPAGFERRCRECRRIKASIAYRAKRAAQGLKPVRKSFIRTRTKAASP